MVRKLLLLFGLIVSTIPLMAMEEGAQKIVSSVAHVGSALVQKGLLGGLGMKLGVPAFAAQYVLGNGMGFFSVVAHEYGHAITAELLSPGSVECIVIGKLSDEEEKKLDDGIILDKAVGLVKGSSKSPFLNPIITISSGKIGNHLSLYQMEWAGHVRMKLPQSACKQIAIFLAGPLIGASVGVLCLYALPKDPKKFFVLKLLLSHMITRHLVTTLIADSASTASTQSDGSRIQKALGVNENLYNGVMISAILSASFGIIKTLF